jgi:DNA-directed RNA polymerase specialized sigma subunit
MMPCKLKKCSEYKKCLLKKNPFQDGKICQGYLQYINQDISLKKGQSFEIPFTSANIKEEYLQEQIVFQGFSDRGKLIIQLYFFDKATPSEIASQLYCSEQYVYKVISQCKKFLKSFIGKKVKTVKKRKK